jgi:hypothetical protein
VAVEQAAGPAAGRPYGGTASDPARPARRGFISACPRATTQSSANAATGCPGMEKQRPVIAWVIPRDPTIAILAGQPRIGTASPGSTSRQHIQAAPAPAAARPHLYRYRASAVHHPGPPASSSSSITGAWSARAPHAPVPDPTRNRSSHPGCCRRHAYRCPTSARWPDRTCRALLRDRGWCASVYLSVAADGLVGARNAGWVVPISAAARVFRRTKLRRVKEGWGSRRPAPGGTAARHWTSG